MLAAASNADVLLANTEQISNTLKEKCGAIELRCCHLKIGNFSTETHASLNMANSDLKFQYSRNKRKIVFEWEYAVSDTNRTAAMSMMMGNNPFQMMESIISGNSDLLEATLTRRVELRFEDIAELRFDHGTGTSTRHNNQDVLQIRMYSPPKVTQRESFGSKIFIDSTAGTANGQTQLSSVYTFSHLGWGRKRGSIATAIETLFHREPRLAKSAFVHSTLFAHPTLSSFPDRPPKAPKKKTAKKRAAATGDGSGIKKKARTAKSLGLSKQEFASIKPGPIKKCLKDCVRTLAKQIHDDWHDGWEEQGETLCDWFRSLGREVEYVQVSTNPWISMYKNARANPWKDGTGTGILQRVINIGIGRESALYECNEILKAVADSWYDMCACPMRGTVEDACCNGGATIVLSLPDTDNSSTGHTGQTFELGQHQKAWMFVWVALLRVHATLENVDRSLLLQCVKDATTHDVIFENGNEDGPVFESLLSGDGGQKQEGDCWKSRWGGPPLKLPNDGKALDVILADEQSWKALPSTRKTHKMRRGRDARFD
jgi:hypothetical protein